MDFLIKLFSAMFSMPNLVFTLGLFAVFLMAFLAFERRGETNFVKQAPTLLTSIGIFGTFFGIVYGFIDFSDVNDIKDQVNTIIKGMKTAFVSSLLGLCLSLVLKGWVILRTPNNEAEDVTDSRYLLDTFVNQAKNTELLVQKIDTLVAAIGKDNDNSLLGQTRLLRSDFNDAHKVMAKCAIGQIELTKKGLSTIVRKQAEHMEMVKQGFGDISIMQDNYNKVMIKYTEEQVQFVKTGLDMIIAKQTEQNNAIEQAKKDKLVFETKLWQEMAVVTKTLSRSATEAIINALKEVIQDFNKNLTEQFGENFKELNNAVYKLVEWQDNYKAQIEQMTQQYAQGVQAIQSTENSVKNIESSAEVIPVHMQSLGAVITDNQARLHELTEHLGVFSQIRDKAIEALPAISKNIDEVLNNMNKGSQEVATAMTNVASDFDNNTKSALGNIEATSNVIKTRSEEIDRALQNSVQYIQSATQTWIKDFEKSIKEVLNNMNKGSQEVATAMTNVASDFDNNTKSALDNIEVTSNVIKTRSEEIDRALQNSVQYIQSATQTWIKDFEQSIKNAQRLFEQSLKEMGDAEKQFIREEMNRLLGEVKGMYTTAQNDINDVLRETQTAMGKTQDKAIADMGRSLVNITGQFAKDYERLTAEMKKVVGGYNNRGNWQ